MTKKKLVQITADQRGIEVVMVRVDKTVKELMEERPSSKWTAPYWHPKYEEIKNILVKFDIKPLDEFIVKTVSGYRGKTEYVESGGVQSIEAVSMLSSGTGIDPYLSRQVKIGGIFDGETRRTKIGDLLFARSGVATAGRSALVSKTSDNMVIGGHILRVVLNDKISHNYIQVYLKTKLGWEMLDRVRAGVGALVLDEEDVRAIVIPILPSGVIKNIDSSYKKVIFYHDQAITAKKDNDEAGYKKNLEIAEKTQNDLVAKTEAVILGKSEDIID